MIEPAGAMVGARLEKMGHGWRRVKPFIPWALGGLVVLAGLILVLIYVPKIQVPTGYWLNPKVIFDMENEARRTLAYIIGGLLVFIGIILTFWQIRILGKQVHVVQEGQITERFTRAIEQLGSDKMEIRLGGIYALERIANDSDKDYWPIMETLTAYVRENTPCRKQAQRPLVPSLTPKPATDIQAVLTVLGRRRYSFINGEDQPLDLSETFLEGAYFSGHWEYVLFMNANMNKADFNFVRLEGAELEGAYLMDADLKYAFMEEAILAGAQMEGADLRGATGLTWKQLSEAIIDDKTKLPDYLQEQPPKAKGPERNNEE